MLKSAVGVSQQADVLYNRSLHGGADAHGSHNVRHGLAAFIAGYQNEPQSKMAQSPREWGAGLIGEHQSLPTVDLRLLQTSGEDMEEGCLMIVERSTKASGQVQRGGEF